MFLHPTSALNSFAPPPYVVFHELVFTNRGHMRHAVPVKSAWLDKLLPLAKDVDVPRLSGGAIPRPDGSGRALTAKELELEAAATAKADAEAKAAADAKRAEAAAAAKARFLARKNARSGR